VSGCYRAVDAGFEVELRVDVDGPRTTRRVSADYFRSQGATTTYIGSMRVEEPVVSITQTRVAITGKGLFTWSTKHANVRITIPRIRESPAPAPATLRHLTTGGIEGSAYVCAFESPSFRTVQLEEARELAVTRLSSYDTGSLPSGGPARSLTPAAAFAEAGVELVTGEPVVVDTSRAGGDAAWSDAELHAAMETSFSRWADSPQWAIWLLHAVIHEDPELFGLMFDRRGLQRQGCAVFYGDLSPSSPKMARELIYVLVHELGHGFNLPHCWKRSLGKPPLPSRPDARSWMNYPERFPGGPGAYWSKFGFEFEDVEIAHLRHAFRDSVIMGGAPFAGAAAFDRSERWDSEPRDRGLRLRLHAPRAQVQGVPVTVGLELAATTRAGGLVSPVLGPRPGTIDIAIRDPSGNESIFEPLLEHCRREKLVPLRAGDAPIRDYAFIHYGKYGFAFEDPGLYRVRARYTARHGSVVLSDEVSIDIRRPASRAERDVVKLTYGNGQVGRLMSLVGSDAEGLRGGDQTLQLIIGRHPAHPVADIARVVRGTNLTRRFKLIETDGSVKLRDPDFEEASALLRGVVDLEQLLRARRRRKAPSPVVGAHKLPEIPTLPGVAPAVDGFIKSRRTEVGNAVAALVEERAKRAKGRRDPEPVPLRGRRRGRGLGSEAEGKVPGANGPAATEPS